MKRNKLTRLLLVIGIGVAVIVVTYIAFGAFYNNTAPTETDINAADTSEDVDEIIERSNRAGTIRSFGLIIIGIEILGTIVLVIKELMR